MKRKAKSHQRDREQISLDRRRDEGVRDKDENLDKKKINNLQLKPTQEGKRME